jgi:hypothetical protein
MIRRERAVANRIQEEFGQHASLTPADFTDSGTNELQHHVDLPEQPYPKPLGISPTAKQQSQVFAA